MGLFDTKTGFFKGKPIRLDRLTRDWQLKRMEAAISKLPKIQRDIIQLNFGLQGNDVHALESIAEKYSMTKEEIRHEKESALKQLKELLISQIFIPEDIEQKIEEQNRPRNLIIERKIILPVNGGIINVSNAVSEELVAKLKKQPELLRHLNSRLFEQLVAEFYRKFGYDVELTKYTRDGGVDVIAIKHAEVDVKYLIQCKHSPKMRRIGIRPVRELYGVKTAQNATKAILATTTTFTKDAMLFFEQRIWELEPRDREGIMQWVDQYLEIINQ